MPKEMKLEVTGVFNTGMYEYDNQYLFVSLDVAQELAGIQEDVTGLEVATKDRWIAAEVGGAIGEEVGAIRIVRRIGRRRTMRCSPRLRLEKLGMTPDSHARHPRRGGSTSSGH
jgi:lipoprotein-releasing system permease protein